LGLIDGRIRTLLSVLHISRLPINLISVSKMDDTAVKTIFEKETFRMVRGTMVLLKGVWFGTLYMLHGSIISDDCSSSIVLDIGVEEERTLTVSREKVTLWHKKLRHIEKKGFRLLHNKCMVEGITNCSLDFDFCEHCIYGKQNQVRFSYCAMRENEFYN
jgi:hypothetical protein